jgi:hypothetical protein
MPKRLSPTLLPTEKAFATGRWAEIIFRALSARVAHRWRFVSFRGLGKGESRGIVDVLAIRKDTSEPADTSLRRGDLFEFILIQIKGGTAAYPSISDRNRLTRVAKRYGASMIVLFAWRKGVSSQFYKLEPNLEWSSQTGAAIFGGS